MPACGMSKAMQSGPIEVPAASPALREVLVFGDVLVLLGLPHKGPLWCQLHMCLGLLGNHIKRFLHMFGTPPKNSLPLGTRPV